MTKKNKNKKRNNSEEPKLRIIEEYKGLKLAETTKKGKVVKVYID